MEVIVVSEKEEHCVHNGSLRWAIFYNNFLLYVVSIFASWCTGVLFNLFVFIWFHECANENIVIWAELIWIYYILSNGILEDNKGYRAINISVIVINVSPLWLTNKSALDKSFVSLLALVSDRLNNQLRMLFILGQVCAACTSFHLKNK